MPIKIKQSWELKKQLREAVYQIRKMSLYWMSYFAEPYTNSKNKINV